MTVRPAVISRTVNIILKIKEIIKAYVMPTQSVGPPLDTLGFPNVYAPQMKMDDVLLCHVV